MFWLPFVLEWIVSKTFLYKETLPRCGRLSGFSEASKSLCDTVNPLIVALF